MADAIDWSKWKRGGEVPGRPGHTVEIRNPLVPGGEVHVPAPELVRTDTFVPRNTTPTEVLIREGQEAAQDRLRADADLYGVLLSIIPPAVTVVPKSQVVAKVDRDTVLQVAEILGRSQDGKTRQAAAELRRTTLELDAR